MPVFIMLTRLSPDLQSTPRSVRDSERQAMAPIRHAACPQSGQAAEALLWKMETRWNGKRIDRPGVAACSPPGRSKMQENGMPLLSVMNADGIPSQCFL